MKDRRSFLSLLAGLPLLPLVGKIPEVREPFDWRSLDFKKIIEEVEAEICARYSVPKSAFAVRGQGT